MQTGLWTQILIVFFVIVGATLLEIVKSVQIEHQMLKIELLDKHRTDTFHKIQIFPGAPL